MDANLNKKFEYGKCYQHEHFQKKHLHEKYITLLLLQKYKKQSTYANISIFKCGYFSIFNYKNCSVCSKIHNFAYRKMYNNIKYDKDSLHY